jgi:uncharacterized ferredoxin-like protein
MAVYDGKKEAQAKLLDIAAYCVQSALKAPQITGRVELEFKIMTDADLNPLVEAFGLLSSIAAFHAISLLSYSKAIGAGQPPVLLLIGGKNLRKSELAWDCGACGFETCKELNKYAAGIEPDLSAEAKGPFCIWKALDYGMACDWACAQAWHHNVTNRVEMASGWAARAIGYLPDCDIVRGLPLGPMADMFWYSREALNEAMPYEIWKDVAMTNYPHHWGTFPGHGRPTVKSGQRWWETPKTRALVPMDMAAFEQAKKIALDGLQVLRQRVRSQTEKKG